MSSTPPSGGRLFVEPLEARIAPTNLLGLTNNTAFQTDPNYLQYSTAPVAGHLGFVPASVYGVNTPNTFALALSGPNDRVVIFNQVGGFGEQNTFLRSDAGKLIAFFQDGRDGQAPDGQVQTTELIGLSLGKKTETFVGGNVNGDVVTNLLGNGTITLDGVGKPGYKINGLTVRGNVFGNILSGGDINNVTILGTVQNVLAGTAAYGTAYNFSGNAGSITGTIGGGAYAAGRVGASINTLSVVSFTPNGTAHAGDGGALAAGGNINGLTVQADTDAYSIFSGAGGVGSASTKGGNGGGIDSVLLTGVANSVVNRLVTIQAGNGGDNPEGKGGAGGTISTVFTSFQALNIGSPSADLLQQNFLLHGGNGGNGARGGAGGSVLASNINTSIPDDGTSAAEIQILGGNAGLASSGGSRGANGGSISQVNARNLDTLPDAANSTILIQGGDGSLGKSGGDVDSVFLLGRNLIVNGGNGADGNARGGDGGSLVNVTIGNQSNLFTQNLTLNGGNGGAGFSGRGGNGGSINTVSMADSNLVSININVGHANGGNSGLSRGGFGGSISGLRFNNSAVDLFTATTVMRTGNGGNGELSGGGGGNVDNLQLTGSYFNFAITSGNGGSVNAGGNGSGGGGGNLTNVQVSNIPDVGAFPITTTLPDDFLSLSGLIGSVAAGNGGNGTLDGGAGGVLANVNLLTGDAVNLLAGSGGTGGTGAAGAGGNVTTSGANSLIGSVTLASGSAGNGGAGAGDGGTITGFVASASNFTGYAGDITMVAGGGHGGGVGGSILNSGTSLNLLNAFGNVGNLTVKAGAGSAGPRLGGAGGSISNFSGQIAFGGATTLTAGNGGGTDGGVRVGAGGDVNNVTLRGAGDSTDLATVQRVYIDAGDAGVSNANKRGAVGGSVDTITIADLDLDTVVHHVAAGNASGGINRGADGGSISNVRVGTAQDATADIGFRSGVVFGYQANQSGGLFAGVAGGGRNANGVNGSVTDISANAISSIVAGKGGAVNLVNVVEGINLNNIGASAAPRANADGSFANLDRAYFVGSVFNNGNGPGTAGASIFKPGDGLIAAVTINQDLNNFSPQAALTYNENNVLVLFDYQQPNPSPQILNPRLLGIA